VAKAEFVTLDNIKRPADAPFELKGEPSEVGFAPDKDGLGGGRFTVKYADARGKPHTMSFHDPMLDEKGQVVKGADGLPVHHPLAEPVAKLQENMAHDKLSAVEAGRDAVKAQADVTELKRHMDSDSISIAADKAILTSPETAKRIGPAEIAKTQQESESLKADLVKTGEKLGDAEFRLAADQYKQEPHKRTMDVHFDGKGDPAQGKGSVDFAVVDKHKTEKDAPIVSHEGPAPAKDFSAAPKAASLGQGL